MTFWSTQTLKSRLGKEDIVRPYDPCKTREACHELSMGDQYLVTSDPDQKCSTESMIKKLRNEESFVIPPGQFAFLLTEESLTVPDNAIGFISIASKQNFRGLVNVSGFHVDPGYKGILIFAVFNAGPKSVTVEEGDSIFRLWMSNLDDEDESPRNKREEKSLKKISSETANNISGDMASPQSLSIQFTELKEEFGNWKIIHSIGITLIGVFLGAVLSSILG